MASLFTAQYNVEYLLVLEDGKSITIEFSSDNFIYNDEMWSDSDCHVCYDMDDGSRCIIYARDEQTPDKKTLTYIIFRLDDGRDYNVCEMYLNDDLIYSDNVLIR